MNTPEHPTTRLADWLMGWLGIPLTPPSAMAPTIIMTLAVADSVHLLVTFMHQLRQGNPRHAALAEALHVNFQPILLTSLTTAIGFLSLNFSDAPPYQHLGNVVAMGVVAAWVFSTFFLPAFLAVVPIAQRNNAAPNPHGLSGSPTSSCDIGTPASGVRSRSWSVWRPSSPASN